VRRELAFVANTSVECTRAAIKLSEIEVCQNVEKWKVSKPLKKGKIKRTDVKINHRRRAALSSLVPFSFSARAVFALSISILGISAIISRSVNIKGGELKKWRRRAVAATTRGRLSLCLAEMMRWERSAYIPRVKEKEWGKMSIKIYTELTEPQEAFRCYYTFRYPANVCVRNKELISSTP
jgi:hypothetical protein